MRKTFQSETGKLSQIILRDPTDAFVSQDWLSSKWEILNYAECPNFELAKRQFADLEQIFYREDIDIQYVKNAKGLTPDSIYVRDASILTDQGAVLCQMGKGARAFEPLSLIDVYSSLGIPILGKIIAPGKLEGGDTFWLDEETLCVGLGYRTNAEGIRQLRDLIGSKIEIIVVDLPHFLGQADVFHLMSLVSPIREDLFLVYSPLMTVRFRNYLRERKVQLLELPEDEFQSMGGNVLSLSDSSCLMLNNNPATKLKLEAEGLQVFTYEGSEISEKGMGGPTCLTRPLERTVD